MLKRKRYETKVQQTIVWPHSTLTVNKLLQIGDGFHPVKIQIVVVSDFVKQIESHLWQID